MAPSFSRGPAGRRRRLRPTRGVSPVIATILLLSITIILLAVLYIFTRVPLPPPTPFLGVASNYVGAEPVYGNAGDCTVGPPPVCPSEPAEIYTLDQVQAGGSGATTPSYNNTLLIFHCANTIYLEGTLWQLYWNPASGGSPPGGSPLLGVCGAFTPPSAQFNFLLFWNPLHHIGHSVLSPGDSLVVFIHYNESWTSSDPHWHGTPSSCYRNPGSCYIDLLDTGAGGETIAQIPVNPPVNT